MGWIPGVLEAEREERERWREEDEAMGFDRDHGGGDPGCGGVTLMILMFLIWMLR